MGTHENVRKICEYLEALGFSSASERIQEAAAQSFDDPLALVSLALDTAVTAEKNAKYEKCLRISRLGDPVFLRDLLTYKVRQLDLEYVGRLGELHFVQEHKNLIIWGAPGTGKTWMGKAIATKACQEGIRTRWVTYPFLCRELMRLKAEDSRKLEARIKYYCGSISSASMSSRTTTSRISSLCRNSSTKQRSQVIQQSSAVSAVRRTGTHFLK